MQCDSQEQHIVCWAVRYSIILALNQRQDTTPRGRAEPGRETFPLHLATASFWARCWSWPGCWRHSSKLGSSTSVLVQGHLWSGTNGKKELISALPSHRTVGLEGSWGSYGFNPLFYTWGIASQVRWYSNCNHSKMNINGVLIVCQTLCWVPYDISFYLYEVDTVMIPLLQIGKLRVSKI